MMVVPMVCVGEDQQGLPSFLRESCEGGSEDAVLTGFLNSSKWDMVHITCKTDMSYLLLSATPTVASTRARHPSKDRSTNKTRNVSVLLLVLPAALMNRIAPFFGTSDPGT